MISDPDQLPYQTKLKVIDRLLGVALDVIENMSTEEYYNFCFDRYFSATDDLKCDPGERLLLLRYVRGLPTV